MRYLRTAVLFIFIGLGLLASLSYGQTNGTLHININNDRLSVELENVAFGRVLTEIAMKAGFQVDISSDVYEKKLSTRFKDMDIQRGIRRLLSLINEKNYFIYYDSEGSIRKLEVYSTASSKPAAGRPAPRWMPPTGPTLPSQPPMTETPQPPVEQPMSIEELEDIMDEPVTEAPYIPPKQEPAYIPPYIK
jgi:hypothetical protein